MSTPNRVKAKDFVEDGKKRIVFLVICAVGLSYLMSLTSSSVWVNLPVATSLVIILRYLSLDFEMKRKAVAYNSRPRTTAAQSSKKPFVFPKVVAKSDWREKVNSPVVEEAMDHFTRHLVSEWVTNLWYSRLTPDREGPEELAQIILGLLGEISGRMRNINLIDLLISDLINLICTHLEVFRATLAKIEKQSSSPLTTESRDTELKLALAADDKLHPALFSAEAEHKVLQHLMEGLMSVTFKHEDLQCSVIRCTARELLAHAVMRPVLNLASPRFLNERIESLVISKTKLNKGANAVQEASHSTEDRLKISSGRFTKLLDSSAGLELVRLGNSHSRNAQSSMQHNAVDTFSRDPLRSIDALLSLLWKSLPSNSRINDNQGVKQYHSGGQRGDISDLMFQRRTQALAPEHFENMWTKGRNYENMDGENQSSELVQQNVVVGELPNIDHKKATLGPKEKKTNSKLNPSKGTSANLGCSNQYTAEDTPLCADSNRSTCPSVTSFQDDDQSRMHLLMVDSGSSTSYSSEDDETSMMNSPGTKVWDGRGNRNRAVSLIHHPLEHFDSHSTKMNKIQSRNQRLHKTRIGWKRSSGHNMQEVKRTSFLSRDGQDILRSSRSNVNSRNFSLLSDDFDIDNLGRIHSGGAASSSAPSISRLQSCRFAVNPLNSSLPVDSFSKLRCEVLCANIVKSGSRTFAVYSISVTDVNNRSWTIKRRFRHFEELHRHLKKFPDYKLQLPSKHFLSTGLDVTVVQERCKLLDVYLKELMQLPIVSGSIEAWDFLSIDSQTYCFSNLLSIVKTLSVDVDDKPSEKRKGASDFSVCDLFASRRENNVHEINEAVLGKEPRGLLENSGIDTSVRAGKSKTSPEKLQRTQRKKLDGSIGVSDVLHDISDAFPTEWVPPNLSVPILDLVDVIFQLQDGGWIRRKIFWVVKQILQLGMGDAFDDWLLDKIQLLRKGSVIASGISRVEQILWPDGIFITKHPRRRPPHGQKPKDLSSQMIADKQKQEEDRRAKFVYELMIDHAPTAIVGLVGRKEYEQCARNLYFFLQSSVCLKQLAFDLLELLMVTAFPELDYVCKQLHEEKHKFGEFNRN